ncbi:MAG: TonB-dependent receptor [Halioglobus sp.]
MSFTESLRKNMGTGLLSLTLCSSMLALADQSEQNPALEEVIVKAHRRAQNIERIGASITAFSGERFQELAFGTVTDLSEQVPNLTFATPAGESTNPALSLRGIGLNDLSDSNEGPVAVYIDEVYLGTLTAQAGQLFDLERVEVLRGPQGTLYGRNTTGGLVHFYTAPPTDTFSSYAQFSYGNDERTKFEAAIGGTIGSRLTARVSILHDSDDGYQRDRTSGESFGTKDISAIRGQLNYSATKEIDVRFMLQASRTDNRPTLYKSRGLLTADGNRCTNSQIVARQCFDGFGYKDPVKDPHSVELHPDMIGPRQEIDTQGGSITATWVTDKWNLTSITAASTLDKVDWDGAFANPVDLFQSGQLLDAQQFSQELRAGLTNDSADYAIGLFYFTDTKKGSIPFNSPLDYDTDFDQDTDAYAAFAHGQWQFAEQWSVSAGARYTVERKSLDFLVKPGTIAGEGLEFEDKLNTDKPSWNLGLTWQVADSTMLFGNLAHGFKSGGWNSGGFVVIPEQIEPFDDETVTTFEIGIKSTLFQNRMRLSATGFYYDYQDLQAFTQANVDGLPLSALTNVGSADIYGFEAELQWRPTAALETSLGIGWLDTSTNDFFSFEGLTPGGEPIIEDLSGSELVLAPPLTTNGIIRYSTELQQGGLLVQLDFSYSDSYFFDTDNAPLDTSDSSMLWNGRVAWLFPRGNFEISLFGRNLTDEENILEGFDIFDTQMLIYNHARTYGVSLRYAH